MWWWFSQMKLVLFRAYGFYTFRDFIADGGLASYGIKFRRTTDKRRTASNSCGRSSEQCGDLLGAVCVTFLASYQWASLLMLLRIDGCADSVPHSA
jgi:hypothetical protein